MEFKQPLGSLIDKFKRTRMIGLKHSTINNAASTIDTNITTSTTYTRRTIVRQSINSVIGVDAVFEIGGRIRKDVLLEFGDAQWLRDDEDKGKEKKKW